ncbi:MAG: SMI1/KNR4 family protein [Solobacterium sp.]|nr:SMI1/KNR4 family protein [Solobacterium sp.]
MNELIELIRSCDNFASMEPAESLAIEKAEQILGVTFAEDYAEYLKAFGVATFDGHEMTGICKSDRLYVVSSTNKARSFYPLFPKSMYVVEELQYDHVLVVQDSSGAVYYYGPKDEATLISDSLQAYFFADKKYKKD